MKKFVSHLVVDRYLIKNPTASSKAVMDAVGCAASTVHNARIRLGIPTTTKERQQFLLKDATKPAPQVAPSDSKKFSAIADDLGQHWNEIRKLQENRLSDRVALMFLYVAVLAIAGVLVFKG
jgi:ribosome recycling factor